MTTNECEQGKQKQLRTIFTVVQSCLIVLLIALVILMMAQINRLQGTARVINYAGLVRGATQRLIKLELTKHPSDELHAYLDNILSGLKYEEGDYNLICLDDEDYQNKLDALMCYWDDLKAQVVTVRSNDYTASDMTVLLEMSEVYFELADATVSAAEVYSEKIAKHIRMIEMLSAIDMCMLSGIIIEQSISAMRMRKKNQLLAKKAYIDMHTGLNNKNMCEELLRDETPICTPTACLMFDINNLKHINDTLGHLAGDQLIANFANNLKQVARETDFVGRCGGDEFMIVLYDVKDDTAEQILKRLSDEIAQFNSIETNLPVSYAQGFAVSTNYEQCTLRTLFQEADHNMYINKQRMKGLL